MDEKRVAVLSKKMAQYAVQSSQREKNCRRGRTGQRRVEKSRVYAALCGRNLYRQKISGVTNFGLFVQLENSVEGLVHISTLVDDFYQFRPESFSLLGEHSRKIYQLGQDIRVRLTRVNVEDRQIDF